MNEQEQKLINMLTEVKEQFIKDKEELVFSIRKDVVAAELRDIVISNPDFYSLKNAIEQYCEKLLKL